MRNFYWIFLLAGFFVSPSVFAKDKSVSYTIGTTDYMIREARQAKAYRFAAADYQKALQYQTWSKQALSGNYKMKVKNKTQRVRSKAKALEFTQQAYVLAKSSRDVGLKALNRRF